MLALSRGKGLYASFRDGYNVVGQSEPPGIVESGADMFSGFRPLLMLPGVGADIERCFYHFMNGQGADDLERPQRALQVTPASCGSLTLLQLLTRRMQ